MPTVNGQRVFSDFIDKKAPVTTGSFQKLGSYQLQGELKEITGTYVDGDGVSRPINSGDGIDVRIKEGELEVKVNKSSLKEAQLFIKVTTKEEKAAVRAEGYSQL